MLNFFKNKFIKTYKPILVIVIILIICIFGFIGVRKYSDYKNLQQNTTQELIQQQQKSLEEAIKEINDLKSANQATSEKLDKKINQIESKSQKTDSIGSTDLEPYITSVVEITCKDSSGSGSLWNIDSKNVVITNDHVVETPFYSSYNKQSYCVVFAEKINGDFDMIYTVFPSSKWNWNNETDIAVMNLVEKFYPDGNPLPSELEKPANHLNFKISTLKKCPSQIAVGSPVVVIGYPASGMQETFNGMGIDAARIVTNGVVSGYDKTVNPPYGGLLNPNYYVSAKIDSGSSGGIALSRNDDKLCVLGIPTWINVGNYDTQGVIQNIHNVMK